jgi:hypothetical protein
MCREPMYSGDSSADGSILSASTGRWQMNGRCTTIQANQPSCWSDGHAEIGGAEVFLTTDDSLRLRALREASKLSVHVENPAKWYAEVITP